MLLSIWDITSSFLKDGDTLSSPWSVRSMTHLDGDVNAGHAEWLWKGPEE